MTDERPPWERQSGEPSRAFHGFAHFRDLGAGRSIAIAYRTHRTTCLHHDSTVRTSNARYPRCWGGWSAVWGWVARAEAWDCEIERQVRAAAAKQLVDARLRHLRVIQANLQTATVTSRIVLEAVGDPTQLQKLVTEARGSSRLLLEHLDRAARNAMATTRLVECERLILGLSTESVELDDKRARTIGDQIPSSPRMTELAVEMLALWDNADESNRWREVADAKNWSPRWKRPNSAAWRRCAHSRGSLRICVSIRTRSPC